MNTRVLKINQFQRKFNELVKKYIIEQNSNKDPI